MGDDRLQQLKRAFVATGSGEDEAVYLREQVRVGELSRERIELAAYVGHVPALLATGFRSVRLPLGKWVGELQPRGGVEALRRAALASVGCALEHWGGSPLKSEIRNSWEEAKCFVRCPCRAHFPDWPLIGQGKMPPRYQLWLKLIGIAWPPNAVKAVFEARVRLAQQRVSERVLRDRIRDEVATWALGRGDPLLVGWEYPLARYPRTRVIEEARKLSNTESPSTPNPLVLDPDFLVALQTSPVEEAVDKALLFKPQEQDSTDLREMLELYSEGLRTRDGVLHDFDWYFETGWRELWPEPSREEAVATDFDFNF